MEITKELTELYKTCKQQTLHLKIDKSAGSMYNSWRARVYTAKGKKAGFDPRWNLFKNFQEDMIDGWEHGKILRRKDTTKPYSKENCFWSDKGTENDSKLITLEYNGEIKTLLEWAAQFGQNYNGLRQRYQKGKNYTPEEIIFGKRITNAKKKIYSINLLLDEQQRKNKISKMLSSYRCKDKKYGLTTALTNDELRHIVENGKCVYCGSTENIGLDRLDNSKGHTLDNVVPCCYECNVARGDNFTHEEMKIIGKAIAKVRQLRLQNNGKVFHNLRVVPIEHSNSQEDRQHSDTGSD